MRDGTSRLRFWLAYAPIVLLVLGADLFDRELLRLVTKPLLMPGIYIYLYLHSRDALAQTRRFRRGLYLALLFSWFGDVLLMFSGGGEYLFLSGLLAFFAAHTFYIAAFLESVRIGVRQAGGAGAPFLTRYPLWVMPFVLLLAGLYGYLFPDLGALRIPVLFYALVILAMAAFALNRRGVVSPASFRLVLLGSLLFIFSDTILAVNRFSLRLPNAQLMVMVSYIAAQYLIAEGAIAQLRSLRSPTR